MYLRLLEQRRLRSPRRLWRFGADGMLHVEVTEALMEFNGCLNPRQRAGARYHLDASPPGLTLQVTTYRTSLTDSGVQVSLQSSSQAAA